MSHLYPVSCLVVSQLRKSGKMPLHKNMAKVSGSLRWAQELKARLDANMESFNAIEHP